MVPTLRVGVPSWGYRTPHDGRRMRQEPVQGKGPGVGKDLELQRPLCHHQRGGAAAIAVSHRTNDTGGRASERALVLHQHHRLRTLVGSTPTCWHLWNRVK